MAEVAPGKASHEWRHPGGKLRELGPEALTNTELLAIVVSSGIKGKSVASVWKCWGYPQHRHSTKGSAGTPFKQTQKDRRESRGDHGVIAGETEVEDV